MTNKKLLINLYNQIKQNVNEITDNNEIIQLVTDHLFQNCAKSNSLEMFGHQVADPYTSYHHVGFKYDEVNKVFYAIHNNKPGQLNQIKLSKSDIKNIALAEYDNLVALYELGTVENGDLGELFNANTNWKTIVKQAIYNEYMKVYKQFRSLNMCVDFNVPLLPYKAYENENYTVDMLFETYALINYLYMCFPAHIKFHNKEYFYRLKTLIDENNIQTQSK